MKLKKKIERQKNCPNQKKKNSVKIEIFVGFDQKNFRPKNTKFEKKKSQ